MEKSTITAEDFSISLRMNDRTRQELAFNITQQNLIDIYRTLYPQTAKSTLFSKQMPRQIIFWAVKQTSRIEIYDIIRNICV